VSSAYGPPSIAEIALPDYRACVIRLGPVEPRVLLLSQRLMMRHARYPLHLGNQLSSDHRILTPLRFHIGPLIQGHLECGLRPLIVFLDHQIATFKQLETCGDLFLGSEGLSIASNVVDEGSLYKWV
jgi:hypothetical protein